MNKEELQACAAAKSDQIDADNLIGGITMDVTITAVQRGPSNEQPLQLVLKETDKFYRPSKTFRRALIGCFGDDPANWIGQRLRLVRNPDTMFGGVKVGGVEVSHASIKEPMVFMLAKTRGRKGEVRVGVIPNPTTPMPQKVKDAVKPKPAQAAPAVAPAAPARGTVSGDPAESDLSDIGITPDPTKPSAEQMAKLKYAFLTHLSMTPEMIAHETGFGPIEQWTIEQFEEAREVFKALKIERAAMAAPSDDGAV